MFEKYEQFDAQIPTRARPSWRRLLGFVLTVLLHLLVFAWLGGVLDAPRWEDKPANIAVELKPETVPKPHKVVVTSQPFKLPQTLPKPAELPLPSINITPAVADEAAPSGNGSVTTKPGVNSNKDKPTPPVVVADAKPDGKDEPPPFKFDLPPPTELKYDVKNVSADHGTYYGSGTISWQVSSAGYEVDGKVGMLFFTLLNFSSAGKLDDYGLAPELYNEKTRTKSATNTHFNRDARQNISFSASTNTYPLKGGEQDRGSILWQLAGIARGDPQKFVAGAQFDLFVAGVRDGEVWSILVAGEEEIETGDGKTTAWHVVRTPRPGTYDKKIDIWLAPKYNWSPVHIRYTEKNGDYTDMLMSSFHPLLATTGANGAAH
jgi:hypothetical protein